MWRATLGDQQLAALILWGGALGLVTSPATEGCRGRRQETGNLQRLSCEAGRWSRYLALYWKFPVADLVCVSHDLPPFLVGLLRFYFLLNSPPFT